MRLVSVVASVLLLAGCASTGTVTINQAVFEVTIADEPAEQELGLGDTSALASNQGMLFLFADSAPQTFWMKDVEYPIDIIWINDQTVVGSVTAYPGPGTYASPQPVDTVLEVPAGTVVTEQIEVGDNVDGLSILR
ncbi:MAG: hypothetical protein ACD_41C00127G0002 [uncultured bacterium]|nr:MAG: hypothetical protein ACD_41C00127G0002 [uncultured bacterium]